jgi:amino acid transporter
MARVTTDDAAKTPRPVRAITRFDFTLAVVNGVVGSAVFGMPGQIAALTGVMSPLAHVIAALAVLSIVLCFAEVASRFDESGGAYLYAREAFGRTVGFQAGWLTLWTRLLSAAANLNVFASYLAQLAPGANRGAARVAVILAVLAVITVINVRGVKQGSLAIDLFTAVKLLPLLGMVFLGLSAVSPETLATQAIEDPRWTDAILLLVFAFGGFEAPLMAAGEARNAKGDSAVALLAALGIIATLYVSVQYVAIGVVPNLARSEAPIAAVFEKLIGPSGLWFASIAAMVSVSGWAMGNGLQTPRLVLSLSERGDLPQALARIHPRFRTPDVAIILVSAVAGFLAILGTFTATAVLSAIVRLILYGLVVASLFVFRKRMPRSAFHLRGAPVVATGALGFCAFMLATRPLGQAWIIGLMMLAGHLLLLGRRRFAASRT